MDNKEIPPYDLDMPFDDDNNNNNDINIVPIESDDLLGLQLSENEEINTNNIDNINNFDNIDNITDDVGNDIGNINNTNEAESIVNVEQFTEIRNPEDIPDESSERTPDLQKQPNRKQNDGSIIGLLLFVIISSIIVIFVIVVFLFADNLNIPFLKKKDTAKINKIELTSNDSSKLDGLDNNSVSSEGDLSNVENESSEDTGIEITREKNNFNDQNQNYPSLPGVDNNSMQNNQLSNMTYYSNGNIGRLDPFSPINDSGGELFEIIVPPVDPTPDTETQALMSLKITGIMYTPDSPSAIINIAGQDQLVRSGDRFDGFSVERITKDKVTVKTGVNVYTASVGEILNIEQVGINSIPNLNKKFAGPYYKGKDKIIEINMTE